MMVVVINNGWIIDWGSELGLALDYFCSLGCVVFFVLLGVLVCLLFRLFFWLGFLAGVDLDIGDVPFPEG